MANNKLSPHFRLNEFCVTSSGANVVQANREYASQPENIAKLTELSNKILEPIRAELIKSFGLKFMTITSGVRTAGTKIANASATSQHNHCEAVDFVITGKLEDTVKLFRLIMEGKIKGLDLKYIGQCILERRQRRDGTWSTWIHISLKTKRFINQRKASKNRNYTVFPEFMISLNGYKYVPVSEEAIEHYLDKDYIC